jgi:hypothetical protein
MATILVEDPSGIHSIAVSDKNPYKKVCEQECETGGEPVQFGDETILYISSEMIEQVRLIEKYAFIVKLITMFDFLLSMFYYFSSGFWYAYIMSVVSLFGYMSTNNFRRGYIIGYLSYQYLCAIIKTFFMGFIYYNFYFKHKIMVDETVFYFLPFNTMCQWYMFHFVRKFYKLLPPT